MVDVRARGVVVGRAGSGVVWGVDGSLDPVVGDEWVLGGGGRFDDGGGTLAGGVVYTGLAYYVQCVQRAACDAPRRVVRDGRAAATSS